jgi:DNA-binding NtrC family response regulator
MKPLKILILDDEKIYTDKLAHYFENSKFQTFTANAPAKAFEILHSEKIDILICDYILPEMDGLEVVAKVKSDFPEVEVIMISAHGDMDTVIEATRLGAIDFIKKPLRMIELQLAVERTGKFIQLQNQMSSLENDRSLISRQLENLIDRDFVGISEKIQKVRDMALLAAKEKDVNVLVTGENGTGKEIIARIIHYASERSKKPFYPVNSAAIPETLLESEFFGHKKGAFTDATSDKKGCFELADGGTLFLDEISEMPAAMQAKLLRAIEEKKIKPVGGSKEISVDVRIIAATNKDIEKLIEENKFRLDLFHRINTLIINIPPLRERLDDIEPLVDHFVTEITRKKNLPLPKIQQDLLDNLKQYAFPGNVRELRNLVERALILSEGKSLRMIDFPLTSVIQKTAVENQSPDLNLDSNEKTLILMALEQADYNQVKAAESLGILRDALRRKMQKHNIKIRKNT